MPRGFAFPCDVRSESGNPTIPHTRCRHAVMITFKTITADGDITHDLNRERTCRRGIPGQRTVARVNAIGDDIAGRDVYVREGRAELVCRFHESEGALAAGGRKT